MVFSCGECSLSVIVGIHKTERMSCKSVVVAISVKQKKNSTHSCMVFSGMESSDNIRFFFKIASDEEPVTIFPFCIALILFNEIQFTVEF